MLLPIVIARPATRSTLPYNTVIAIASETEKQKQKSRKRVGSKDGSYQGSGSSGTIAW